MPTEINLGEGKVSMSVIEKDGASGISFVNHKERHPIDSKDPNWKPTDNYILKEDEVVIWCSNLDSARVFQDMVSILALELNERTVLDTKK